MPTFSEMPGWTYSWTHTNRNMLKCSLQWSLWVWGTLLFLLCILLLEELLWAGTRGNYVTWINAGIHCWPCKYHREAEEGWD